MLFKCSISLLTDDKTIQSIYHPILKSGILVYSLCLPFSCPAPYLFHHQILFILSSEYSSQCISSSRHLCHSLLSNQLSPDIWDHLLTSLVTSRICLPVSFPPQQSSNAVNYTNPLLKSSCVFLWPYWPTFLSWNGSVCEPEDPWSVPACFSDLIFHGGPRVVCPLSLQGTPSCHCFSSLGAFFVWRLSGPIYLCSPSSISADLDRIPSCCNNNDNNSTNE